MLAMLAFGKDPRNAEYYCCINAPLLWICDIDAL